MPSRNEDGLMRGWPARLAREPILVVGALATLGAMVRIYHLGFKSLWYDEAVVYWISRGTLEQSLSQNALGNSAPPLFALLLKLISALGESETILRSLSALAGTVAVPVMFLLAGRLVSRNAAYFCALLVAIAPTQIEYSQQVREYSLVVLLTLLMLLAVDRFMDKPVWRNWWGLTLAWLAAVFTQYGLALVILAFNIVFLASLIGAPDRKTLLARWSLAQMVAVAAVVVVYETALKHQVVVGGFGAQYLSHGYWEGTATSLLSLGYNTLYIVDFAYPDRYLFLTLMTTGAVAGWSATGHRRLVLALVLSVSVVFGAALLRLYPYLAGRQVIFLTPMMYLLAGVGFDYLLAVDKRRILVTVLLSVLAVTGAKASYEWLANAGRENLRPVVATLAAQVEAQDRVFVYSVSGPAFRYYYRSGKGEVSHDPTSPWAPIDYGALDGLLSQPGRLWLVFSSSGTTDTRVDTIVKHVSSRRSLDLVHTAQGARLYLVR